MGWVSWILLLVILVSSALYWQGIRWITGLGVLWFLQRGHTVRSDIINMCIAHSKQQVDKFSLYVEDPRLLQESVPFKVSNINITRLRFLSVAIKFMNSLPKVIPRYSSATFTVTLITHWRSHVRNLEHASLSHL